MEDNLTQSVNGFTPELDKSTKVDEEEDEMDQREEQLDEEEDYEAQRLRNIRERDALLAKLGLQTQPKTPIRQHTNKPKPKTTSKKTSSNSNFEGRTRSSSRSFAEPSRRSLRVSTRNNSETPNEPYSSPVPIRRQPPLPRATAPIIPSGPLYEPVEGGYKNQPIPSRDEFGVLIFEGRWKGIFTPNITPQEMFSGGAFGGSFFCDTYSKILETPLNSNIDISDLPFPTPPLKLLITDPPDPLLNKFGVKAGQSLQDWEKSGWIWKGDPRGWAQWYFRFWGGRRCEDDERQVRRWLNLAGPSGRFKRALLKRIQASGGKLGGAVEDIDVGRTLRQCLWQWGYELRMSEWDAAMRG